MTMSLAFVSSRGTNRSPGKPGARPGTGQGLGLTIAQIGSGKRWRAFLCGEVLCEASALVTPGRLHIVLRSGAAM
jgi:hypothetical protein